jgi:hypothetical protein
MRSTLASAAARPAAICDADLDLLHRCKRGQLVLSEKELSPSLPRDQRMEVYV